MSGAMDVCFNCQGTYHAQYEMVGKYLVSVGWCDTCNKAILVWDERAYEDEDFDVDTESQILGKREYDERFGNIPDYRLIDIPRSDCRQCIHGFNSGSGIQCRNGLEVKGIQKGADMCKDYYHHDIWAFERFGYETCPECGKDAFVMRNKVKCYDCGWSRYKED